MVVPERRRAFLGLRVAVLVLEGEVDEGLDLVGEVEGALDCEGEAAVGVW